MIMASRHRMALSALLVAGVAACGNSDDGADLPPVAIAIAAIGDTVREMRADEAAAEASAKRTPEQMAAEALRVNPAPLVMVGFESLGRTQVLAMTGQNGSMRTYMAPSKEAIIMRDGMVIGTRGLGNDQSVIEAQTDPLIRAARPGKGSRIMRYYSGDGLERALAYECEVAPGPKPGVVTETCTGNGARFQNNYMPQGGQIPVSRQWLGPKLGYVTVQTLRP